MFDIGASELLVIGAVALVVLGPKELPGLLRGIGEATAKIRRMASEFRGQFDDAMREAELDQAKKAFNDVNDVARSASTGFNPLDTIRNELSGTREVAPVAAAAAAASATAAMTPAAASAEPAPIVIPPPPEPAPIVLPAEIAAVAEPQTAPANGRNKADRKSDDKSAGEA
jgi:sec-independent protein translocase protein TatB